jgi:hypothetical protein
MKLGRTGIGFFGCIQGKNHVASIEKVNLVSVDIVSCGTSASAL